MSDTTNQGSLEDARTRLETALSALAQGVAHSREAQELAAREAQEKAGLSDKVTALEQENLKLHEQIAALALQPGSDTDRINELESEKAAIENNYQMLKSKYVALQDTLDAQPAVTVGESANDNVVAAENSRLKQIIAEMEAEKNAIKSELDKTISELETMLGDA